MMVNNKDCIAGKLKWALVSSWGMCGLHFFIYLNRQNLQSSLEPDEPKIRPDDAAQKEFIALNSRGRGVGGGRRGGRRERR